MSILGNNIKKYRELKGLTQKQLADAIGKSKNVISNRVCSQKGYRGFESHPLRQ